MRDFRGKVLRDEKGIAAYAQDMSGLRITPRCVAIPEDDSDIEPLLFYAERNNLPITPRGAGSNQSGSAVGPGMVLATMRMDRAAVPTPGMVRAQAGSIHARVDEELNKVGRTLAFDPSSRTFCTIGGNIATKASGLRGLKYGSVDRWIDSARFICPAFGTVNTLRLPKELEKAMEKLRDDTRANPDLSKFVKGRRGLKTSSGYNIAALFDHEGAGEIAAHLLCGSVGTLGVITDADLRTIPLPPHKALLLLFAGSLDHAIAVSLRLRGLRPSALELIDKNGLAEMKLDRIDIPADAEAMLMMELDENVEGISVRVKEAALEEGLEVRRTESAEATASIWKVREAMLLRVKKRMENEATIVPPFVEDLAVPPDRIVEFARKVIEVVEREGLEPVVYGHVGEGNLHFRVPIPRSEAGELADSLGDECVRIAISLGGTVTAEHGSGRLRLRFASIEFSEPVLELFDRIKGLFDPKGLLNPGVIPTP